MVSLIYNGNTIEPNGELSYDPPKLSKWDLFWRSPFGKVLSMRLFVAATVLAIVVPGFRELYIGSVIGAGVSLCIGGAISGWSRKRNGGDFWEGFADYINENWSQTVAINMAIALVTYGISQAVAAVRNCDGPKCFIAGTLVLCRDENGEECHKPIEEVEVGDMVWSYDEETGESDWKPVVRLFRNETKEWCTVSVAVGGRTETITSTPGHKYYLPKNTINREGGMKPEHKSYKGLSEKWVSACKLKSGDKVLLSNGEYGIIQSVKVEELVSPETTYNLEVADFHTYYVGEQGILVHNNQCRLNPKDIRYTQDTISNTFKKGPHAGERVDDLIDALKAGTVTPDDIPALQVYKQNGKIYSANNRRLFAYKAAGVKSVPVEWITKAQMSHPFTSPNDGLFLINVIGGSRYF